MRESSRTRQKRATAISAPPKEAETAAAPFGPAENLAAIFATIASTGEGRCSRQMERANPLRFLLDSVDQAPARRGG